MRCEKCDQYVGFETRLANVEKLLADALVRIMELEDATPPPTDAIGSFGDAHIYDRNVVPIPRPWFPTNSSPCAPVGFCR